MCGVYFSSVNAKTGRRKNTTKKLQTIEKMACSSAFGTPGWARTSGLSLRRRPLYPTELRGLMQKIFNYPAQQDSNELPLRRRMLYPLSYWGICLCIVQCFSALVKRASPVCHTNRLTYRRSPAYRRISGCSARPARSQKRFSQPASARSCRVFCAEKPRSRSSSPVSSLC